MIYSLQSEKVKPSGLLRARLHYNCAIVDAWRKRWLIYRCQDSLQRNSWLGASVMEGDRPVWTRRLVTAMETAEDPRATFHDGRLYVFYNSGCPAYPKIRPWDMTIRVAVYDDSLKLVQDRPLRWVGRQPCEKNWQVFYHSETRKWYAIYSVSPWRVLEFDENWDGNLIYEADHGVRWDWGEIRGGSCPVRVLPQVGVFTFDELASRYWAWFHSSFMPARCTKAMRQYVGGIMCFSSELPFAPVGMSSHPVLVPNLTDKTVVGANVLYPAGAIFNGKQWLVSAGSGDCQCRLFTCLHDELIDGRNFRRLAKSRVSDAVGV